jgi:hypothetical protein
MLRLAWLVLLLPIAACGGGQSPATLSISCAGGIKLVGAASTDVAGNVAGGRPTISFPDPANPGKTGTISVQPHDHCKVTPTDASGG